MAIVQAGTQHGTPIAAYRSDARGSSPNVAAAPPGGIPFTPSHCTAVTKAGHACQAKPVTGSTLCVGHTKQKAAQDA